MASAKRHREAVEKAASLMGIPYLNALWDIEAFILSDYLRDRDLNDEAEAVLHPPRLFFAGDPARPSDELWHYVYIHGAAEDLVGSLLAAGDAAGWTDEATDLCVLEGEQPTEEGEYMVDLYGKRAAAVLSRDRYGRIVDGRTGSILMGRVVLPEDPGDLLYARNYYVWR